MKEPAENSPLCIDLDGTLIQTDLFLESLLAGLRSKPWLLFMVPIWLLRGKHRVKAELAQRVELDVSVLPYNADVLKIIKAAREQRRPVILVTGSNQKFAMQVQGHLQLFDQVIASDATVNLTGKRKAALLNNLLGEGTYEYVANGLVDLAVWVSAGASITVNASDRLVLRVASLGKPHANIPSAKPGLRSWLRAMRLHQWAKNALLFVALITSHKVFDTDALAAVLTAFLCFGLCASATYIINDLFDLESDRHHRKKRNRPFAAGTISIQAGVMAAVGLLVAGAGLAATLPVGFQLCLAAYLVTTLLYSLRLKTVASLDVVILAGLYTLRIIAGAFAAGVTLTFWLLAFSMFIFLCLALVKRVTELIGLDKSQSEGQLSRKLRGREYRAEDITILKTLGGSSGYLSVLVLALYINSPEVSLLYRTPQILWLIAPLMLLWVTRLWLVTARGYMDEDPIFFAIKDPETWLTAALTAAILVAAKFMSFA